MLIRNFNFTFKEQDFSILLSETSENVCFYFMICFLCSLYSHTVFLRCGEKYAPNSKYTLVLIKKGSKVQEKNMSCERALSFDQVKTFSENYEQIKV